MMKREPSSIADIATFHGVTEDQLRSLKNAMKLTWEGIASDYFMCFEGGEGEAYDSFPSEGHMVAEAVIDSGLIHMYGEADLGWMKKPGLSTMDLGRAAWGARF